MCLRDNLNVLGKIQEKTKPFLIQQKKEVTNIDKDINESVIAISCKTKFI